MTNDPRAPEPCLPEAEHRRYGRILLAVTVAGALFLLGQGARWWQESVRSRALDRAIMAVYERALEAEPGRSPFGRLQFELGKLRADSSQALDMLELLAALSRRAPEGVLVDGVDMAGQSGTAAGQAPDRAAFERYRAALAAEGYFDISASAEDVSAAPVRFTLKIKARDRAAPPKGEDQ